MNGKQIGEEIGNIVVYQRFGTSVFKTGRVITPSYLVDLEWCPLYNFTKGILDFPLGQGFFWFENDYDLSLQGDRNGEKFREIVISF